MSKTPWRASKFYLDGDYDISYIVDADGEEVDTMEHMGLIVAAVNFYSALPEDVRKLKPETVVKCVEAISESNYCRRHREGCFQSSPPCFDCYDNSLRADTYLDVAMAALEAEEANDGPTQ